MKRLSKARMMDNAQVQQLLPNASGFQLPERVLQFGTGVLLRGLPDYFIDKANKLGVFNGRIAVVKSTSSGGTSAFDEQDCMYTHIIRGISQSKEVDEFVINSSISRVISAAQQWNDILEIAVSAELDIIISNTTEVGITLVDESINEKPPLSFPGKLLSILYRRYQAFGGDASKGLVIIPTELIPNNGRLLKSVCLQLAAMNKLEEAFVFWVDEHNHFCDSLVDRIVPGKLSEEQQHLLEEKLGISDHLAILSEPYALWAIEVNDEAVKNRLSFSDVNPEIVLASDINKFRQLKLHILNGTHTFCCGVAFLCGFSTVKEALDNKDFYVFMQQLLHQEIIPEILSSEISASDAATFASNVVDRFGNPFIAHLWQNIALNFSSKMRLRNLPVILSYIEKNKTAPPHMAFAFAAMLLYLHGRTESAGKFYGNLHGKVYPIQDDKVPLLNACWVNDHLKDSVIRLLGESSVWGVDLNKLAGFADAVEYWMNQLSTDNPRNALSEIIKEKKPLIV
jgi:tagaturonate reductase